MQRALVILVVVLLAAVAALAVTIMDLSSTVSELQFREDRDARRGSERRGVEGEGESERVVRLEERLDRATSENTRLRADVRKLNIRISNLAKQVVAATRSGSSGSTTSNGSTDPDGATPVTVPAGAMDRPRDEEGNLIVTDEEMEYFRAVQTKIDRRRRIDGQTRNYQRRIQSLLDRGDIGAYNVESKPDIEKVLREFVTKNDDLVTRYVRKPSAAVQELSNEERREELRVAREKFGAEAQKALAEYFGETDAATIAERVFTNPWGLRSRNFNR